MVLTLLLLNAAAALADSSGAPATATSGESYATCTSANSYLENVISVPETTDAGVQYVSTPSTGPADSAALSAATQACGDATLPPACVLASLGTTADHSYRFGRCATAESRINLRGTVKPCLSRRYHQAVYEGYVRAMRCLGVDPRELFGLIHHESNFQINVGSPTGAWGVGQLTSVAIATINHRKSLEAYASRSECAPIRDVLDAPLDERKPCSWILPPENPTRNFLYAGLTYLTFKGRAERLVRHAGFGRIKAADRAALVSDLTEYMYNGGDGAIGAAFKVYLSEHGGAPFTLATFRAQFRDFIKENYGAGIAYYAKSPEKLAAKRAETADYPATIARRLRQLERKAGVKCSL